MTALTKELHEPLDLYSIIKIALAFFIELLLSVHSPPLPTDLSMDVEKWCLFDPVPSRNDLALK